MLEKDCDSLQHTNLQLGGQGNEFPFADADLLMNDSCRSLDAAHELQRENAAKLEAAEKAAGQEKTVALERQKRFNLLNSQFRKKEVEFTKQVQAVQSRLEEREQTVTSLQAEGQSHQQVQPFLSFSAQALWQILSFYLLSLLTTLCCSCSKTSLSSKLSLCYRNTILSIGKAHDGMAVVLVA